MSTRMQEPAERTQDNMEVRLDAKVTNEKETRALGIEVGDFISFDPRTVVTETGFIKFSTLG